MKKAGALKLGVAVVALTLLASRAGVIYAQSTGGGQAGPAATSSITSFFSSMWDSVVIWLVEDSISPDCLMPHTSPTIPEEIFAEL